MFRITLAQTGETFTNHEIAANPSRLMDGYGPEQVHRIAFTRDDNGTLTVIFANQGGTVQDGNTETIQISVINGKHIILQMQNPTAILGEITNREYKQLRNFFVETYFSGRKKDTVLIAKGDTDLDNQKQMRFIGDKNTTFTCSVVAIEDFVFDGEIGYVYMAGKIAKINLNQLVENFTSSKSLMNGAAKIVVVGQETKLCRGMKVEVAPGATIDTVGYVKNEHGTAKMVLLDTNTLGEVKVLDFDGDYATTDGDKTMVYVMDTVNRGTNNETIKVNIVPAANFGAIAANEAGYPTP